jgi:hypothetical protein
MRYLKIVIIRYLLFFYLTSSYLSATHIHSKALKLNSECKVCIVVKNLNSGDTPTNQLYNLACDGCYEPIVFELETIQITLLKGFNANAPPLVLQLFNIVRD